jgi:hypothetical protein
MIDADTMKDWIWLNATNDGQEYAGNRNAGAAIDRAQLEYVKALLASVAEEFSEMRAELVRDLGQRWGKRQ